MYNIGLSVPPTPPAWRLPLPGFTSISPHGAAIPHAVYNTPLSGGMPEVAAGEHSARLTDADYIISALYQKITKKGDVSTINADLGTLSRTAARSICFGDNDHPQRISNIYLGKALNILCQLVRRSGALPCDAALLLRATQRCVEAIRARHEFTLENASVIMFHLGELINHAPLKAACSEAITRHMVPIFEARLRQMPILAIEGTSLAFGLVSALRASEQQLARPLLDLLPPPAADSLLLTLSALLDVHPNLLTTWENRTLALMVNYGVQYLRRLGQLGWRNGRPRPADVFQLNAARAMKPIIEEARRPSRGVWDQRDSEYRGLGDDRQLRDDLAYGTHYYCRWLAQQPQPVQQCFTLQEAPRGPLPDNPRDGRDFADVLRIGLPPAAVTPPPQQTAGLPPPARVAEEIAALEPPGTLLRFSQAAGELQRLGEAGDRFDREQAVTATNALVVAIESGRTTLSQPLRVQMLLDMDGVYKRLYSANPPTAPQYDLQLSGMRGFMSSQLALLVGSHGAPVMGTDVPLQSGLSSWQRSLLTLLSERDPEVLVEQGYTPAWQLHACPPAHE